MFNERLREIRNYLELTQQQVADAIGVTRSTYAYYETGKTQPSIKTLLAIARTFDVSVEELLYDADHAPKRMGFITLTERKLIRQYRQMSLHYKDISLTAKSSKKG